MAPSTFTTIASEVRLAILEEAFTGSEINITYYAPRMALCTASNSDYLAFDKLYRPQPLTLGSLVNSKRTPYDDGIGPLQRGNLVAKACNDYFGPVTVSRKVYDESLPLFVRSTTFVLEGGVAFVDFVEWLPKAWKEHVARVRMSCQIPLDKVLKGLKDLKGLRFLRLERCEGGRPHVIPEIYLQADDEVEKMLLKSTGFLDGLDGVNTLSELAQFAPSVSIVLVFHVAAYFETLYDDDSTDSTRSSTIISRMVKYWLPSTIDVEIHTKPPTILLNGLTVADYKATYVRPKFPRSRQGRCGHGRRGPLYTPMDPNIPPSQLNLVSF